MARRKVAWVVTVVLFLASMVLAYGAWLAFGMFGLVFSIGPAFALIIMIIMGAEELWNWCKRKWGSRTKR